MSFASRGTPQLGSRTSATKLDLRRAVSFITFQAKKSWQLRQLGIWNEVTGGLFVTAPFRELADPLDRVLAYVDFRKAMLQGEVADLSCLVGTMVQEVYETNPAIRNAYNKSISDHAATVEADIAEAMQNRRRVDRKKPRALQTGCSSGSLCYGKGQRRPESCLCQHRSSSPIFGDALSQIQSKENCS
jgi:hypothetical protein